MSKSGTLIHPNWDLPMARVTDGFSIEITAKDVDALKQVAPALPPETPVSVTFLPGETLDARIAAATAVRSLGFEPMPHFSARRIESHSEFETYLEAIVERAQVRRCFVIAGDRETPAGPFADSSALIATGRFEQAGIKAIGIAGHPDGHPNMSPAQCWGVLKTKASAIEQRGMAPLIVTQFGFDAGSLLAWLKELRQQGLSIPVRLGVPGPAGIKTLLRFAARCGVEASASVMAKYGLSITQLMGSAGPDKMVEALAEQISSEHGRVRLHFYPFGGLEKTVAWIKAYDSAH
ncbi:MAG: methylenetetrahydrofolate reductase [Pseudolabrys sp.]|nr:methylenetetrahydrofolate reductase [Pseudolabrys sp.]MBV9956498.1 methylenetetrahydrofolate reductase [Pseudolabrys sp.]